MMYSMSRTERLERWALSLDRCEEGRLTPFREVEYLAGVSRAGLRQENSPLAVAFADPLLRRAGLDSDRYGDGARFFELSRAEAHEILCSCGYTGTMWAGEVAHRIRQLGAPRVSRVWRPANPLPAVARWLFRSRSGLDHARSA
jgi:hypothetical protein